ncbi:MAG: ribosome hibernation-promoting factor, HPF/YfiA family [Armatimonadota bacterium]
MQIIFSGKHIAVTPAVREYAEGKLSKLTRFFDQLQEVKVTDSILRNQHVVEVTLNADGRLIRAEERSPDIYTTIDLVLEKLERQLKRYKSRFVTRTRESLGGQKTAEVTSPSATEITGPEVEGEVEEQVPEIVRTKRFAMKPMYPDDAAMEMELIGHDFFVFSNAGTNEVNVIYKRRDGNYGLIEPIVD